MTLYVLEDQVHLPMLLSEWAELRRIRDTKGHPIGQRPEVPQ